SAATGAVRGRDARGDRRPGRAGAGRGQCQGVHRQPVRRRRGGPGHRGGSSRGDRPHRRPDRAMPIRFRDTLSGELRPLEPIEPGHVGIYSCGPTVYGPTHIGNFRSFLFADILVRYLRYRGYTVTWVMNVTDIDDRIIERAAAAGVSIGELTDRWTAQFVRDAEAVRMTT